MHVLGTFTYVQDAVIHVQSYMVFTSSLSMLYY